MQQHVIQVGMWEMLADASLIVKLVLLALLSASVFCWAIIFTKSVEFKRSMNQNGRFLDLFWGSKNLEEIQQKTEKMSACPLAGVFRSGYKELRKISSIENIQNPALVIENIQNSLL